ncbi:MAG: hypothetical protein ACFBSD_16825 [Paracoccaceae bacterium]
MLATRVCLLLFLAAPVRAETALTHWVEGEWIDPLVHRCGWVSIGIRIERGQLLTEQLTLGASVPGSAGAILDISETGEERFILFENDAAGRAQRIRYVAPDAHVRESPNGTGGSTFVRCPDAAP